MRAATAREATPLTAAVDYGRISLISLGHLSNDLYGNLITALTPYLVIEGRITATLAGLVLLVYLVGSSVLQPIFGLLSDRSGRRVFAVAGPIWIGTAAGLVGWTTSTWMLFVLAFVGGLGTAAFHPQAAAMVDGLSPTRKAWSMAIFTMGGNIGFASGPIIAAGIAIVGLHWSPVIILPGLVLTAALARWAPDVRTGGGPPNLREVRASIARVRRSLSLIVAVIAVRSAAQYGLIIFLPLYFHARGGSAVQGSYYAFVVSLAGAVGGLVGGRLSDARGRKRVVVGSLAAAAPLLLLSLLATGPLVWLFLISAGAALLASNSTTVVQGQRLLPGKTGIASGVTLGLAFGLSGVITSSFTTAVDHVGITPVMFAVPALPLVAAGLAALVPGEHDD